MLNITDYKERILNSKILNYKPYILDKNTFSNSNEK